MRFTWIPQWGWIRVVYHSSIVTNVTQTPGEKTFTSVKPDLRKCLDIVCEIQRAIFARQLAMFLYGDKMMKLFKLRLHLFFLKKLKWFRKKKEVRRVVFIYNFPMTHMLQFLFVNHANIQSVLRVVDARRIKLFVFKSAFWLDVLNFSSLGGWSLLFRLFTMISVYDLSCKPRMR